MSSILKIGKKFCGNQACFRINRTGSRDPEIALISVVDTTSLITDGGVTPGEMAEILKTDLKKSQQMMIKNVFGDHKVWTFLEEGKPHEMNLKAADEWEADMIALGTHGRRGLSHLLLGSVAEKLIRHSTKPLMITPVR